MHFSSPSGPVPASGAVVRLFDPAAPGGPTVAQVVASYIDQRRRQTEDDGLSPEALANAVRDLQNFAASFGSLAVEQCKAHLRDDWLRANPQWQRHETKKRVVSELCQCFGWAAEQEYISSCPFKRLRDRKKKHDEERRPATPAEYVALMRFGNVALRRALFFIRNTGARPCEMRNVSWPDVDFAASVIVLDEHKTADATGEPRVIPMDPVLLRFLRNRHRRMLASHGVSDPAQLRDQHVFTDFRGNPWKTRHVFDRRFRMTANRLGLAKDLVPYCFRHAYVTDLVEAGFPVAVVSHLAGHRSIRTTERYFATLKTKGAYLRAAAAEARKQRRTGRRQGELFAPELPFHESS